MSVPRMRAIVRLCAVGAALISMSILGSACSWSPESGDRIFAGVESIATPVPAPSGFPVAEKIGPPGAGAYLGVFRPPAPFAISAYDAYQEISPKRPAILMWYQAWDKMSARDFDPALCVTVYQHGAVPLITWEPWNPGPDANYLEERQKQSEYQLSDITDGTFDTYIREWAQGVKAVGGPVMIRPMHEMNGTWYPWSGTVNGNSPALFRKAWRHIHAIFVQEGATNATWVWTVNWESVPDTPENSFSAYYPGDEYVDWVGVSGFNWGTSTSTQEWRSFRQIYEKPLAYLDSLDKPIILSEFATVADGGDKAEWITDAYRQIRSNHPAVKAIVYYDAREKRPEDVQDWRIDSSAASAGAFRSAVDGYYFIAGPLPELDKWLGALSDDDRAYLRRLDPVY